MCKQVFNPYLPGWEYIPDGEPHVHGDRLYVFGSHDEFEGDRFCTNDYVCWSAPVNDLSDWKFHDVIYKKTQDPANKDNHAMFAPDTVQGPDGRFYLYYTLDFMGIMSVAVADKPEGPYEFYGYVKNADGSISGEKEGDVFHYDPGVLKDDDGTVHLYSGVSPSNGPLAYLKERNLKMEGAYHFALEDDMITIKGNVNCVVPGRDYSVNTGYEEHGFFEASSIRKVNGQYYFIYSSEKGYELCYAVSKFPDRDFSYQGTIVSLGDIGLDGRTEKESCNYTGNNHGSIECINGQWYVFYHRHTNGNQLSRQGCAEKISIDENGKISHVETTSCGLNPGFLRGIGKYNAGIACNIASKNGVTRYMPKQIKIVDHPYITQYGNELQEETWQYVTNMQDGSWVGYKYFSMNHTKGISLDIRTSAKGSIHVTARGEETVEATVDTQPSEGWNTVEVALPKVLNGKYALYFEYKGEGYIDFKSFELL